MNSVKSGCQRRTKTLPEYFKHERSKMSKKSKMTKQLRKKMRMSNEEFCETGQVRITLKKKKKKKKKKGRMSYETGQVQTSSVYIRRIIRDAVKEPDRAQLRRRKSTFTQHRLHSLVNVYTTLFSLEELWWIFILLFSALCVTPVISPCNSCAAYNSCVYAYAYYIRRVHFC